MIYLLEDDDSIRKLIIYTLQNQKLDAEGFPRPSLFWDALNANLPDLVLLDIMLPEEDGIEVLKKLRASPRTQKIPVIMVTARNSEYDTVIALDYGADDYISKPFGMMELTARIKAVMRRFAMNREIPEEKNLTFGRIVLNRRNHTVTVGGKPVFLALKEFDLLAVLLEKQGSVITREMLMNSVWDYDSNTESRTIDVHIRNLRQKLGDDGACIETVRGVGFTIRADGAHE